MIDAYYEMRGWTKMETRPMIYVSNRVKWDLLSKF